MFRISDFSRFCRVSLKTLRHYDRLGLLRPARVDPDTRYRWYSAHQVGRLQRILALRELGFTLEHIGDLLEEDPRGKTMRRLLEMRRAEVEHELAADRERLAQLDARIAELGHAGKTAPPEVVLHDLPPVRAATRRARVAELEEGVEDLFESLEADVARAELRGPGPPLLLYHDRDHRERDADVEVVVPVAAEARPAPRLEMRTLAAVPLAACVTYAGRYDQWTSVMRGLLAWLQARRLTPAGPLRESFLQFAVRDPARLRVPGEYLAERGEDLVTEMQIPVRRGSRRAGRRAPG